MKTPELSELQMRTCEALQKDIAILAKSVWSIREIYYMWTEWSEMCDAQWLNYTGDIDLLVEIVDCMMEKFEQEDKKNLEFQNRCIAILQEDIDRKKFLYNLTKHSKKKAAHLQNVHFLERCMDELLQEHVQYWE